MAKKKIISTQYILPTNNNDLLSFTRKYKLDMMEQVVSSIEFAVKNKLPLIEVFQFKNSDFVITLSEKDYITNLENIFNYYMQNESYEYCPRVFRLQSMLKEKSDKNEKQKR